MNKKKGFVLTETLAVTVFIITIFTFIYTAIIPLFGVYKDMAMREENIDIAYKLYHIRKMIKQDLNESEITSNNVKRITCNDLNDKTYCDNLMNYLDLSQYDLIYTKSIASNIESIRNINDEIKEYIKSYSDNNDEVLILLDRNSHVIVHLIYTNKNIMGDIPSNITNLKENIIEVVFKKDKILTINAKFRNIESSKKANVTFENTGRILA